MDPASLTASIITIIGLAGNVNTGLEMLYRLRKAPEEVLALLNEISDFRAVLLSIKDIVDGLRTNHNSSYHGRQREALRSTTSQLAMYIKMANDQLLGLENLIKGRIITLSSAEHEKPSVHRLRFALAGRDIKKFQRELNGLKGKIHLTVSTLTTSQASQVRLGLLNVEAMVSQVRDQQRELNAVNTNLLRDMQQAVAQKDVISGQHEEVLLQNSPDTQAPTTQQTTGPNTPESPQSEILRQRETRNTIESSYTRLNVLQIETTFTPRLACNAWCSCVCHKRGNLQTPSFLQKVVGSLFVGYVGGLVQTPKCDEPRCSRPSQRLTRITYYFPVWFISCAITAAIRGPQVTITALRIRGSDEWAIKYAKEDNWNQLVKLFDKGLSSPLDVDQNGWSVLHWVALHNSSKCCKALLMLGADPDIEDNSMITARDIASRKYLSRRDPQTDAVYHSFGFGHSIEELQLSRLQKIILNLIPGDLEVELQYATSSINTQDTKGATALLWAAFLMDSALFQLLLKHKADPNIADFLGQTPTHWVRDLSCECLIDILRHGADPNVQDNFGVTPLHNVARYCHDPLFVHVLVINGANLNMQDISKGTPLHSAARNGNPTMAACLLEHGAEIDVQDILGYTPLFLAIVKGSYQCLKILLKAGADYRIIRGHEGSILHLAAAFADEATLRILTSFRMSGIDCDLENYNGQDPWDVFWAHHSGDGNDGPQEVLVDAFKELLETIREENLKLALTKPNASSHPQNRNHANSSGDATATWNPPMPGAWVQAE